MSKGVWIVIVLVILGAYFIYSNNSDNELRKIEAEQSYIDQRAENNRGKLTNCLAEVDQRIKEDLYKWCKAADNIKDQYPNEQFIDMGANCALPVSLLENFNQGWEKEKKEGREECYKLYSQ